MKKRKHTTDVVGLYCLDQDHSATASMGIFNYVRQTIAAMASSPNPGFDLIIFVSSRNEASLLPKTLPAWIKTSVVPGNYSKGIRRLIADHIISVFLAKANSLDIIWFPKGWRPFLPLFGIKLIVTLHDDIVGFYAKRTKHLLGSIKALYFKCIQKLSLTTAARIITSSEFSKQQLLRRSYRNTDRVTVIPLGPGLGVGPNVDTNRERSGLLVMGSLLPHKFTAGTLALLNAYSKTCGSRLQVTVTGIAEWPHSWGPCPQNLDIAFVGRIDNEQITKLILSSKALIYLSEIEGFGMPAIEAYYLATPVCFRKSHALKETLRDFPGGWDGYDQNGFFKALDEVMSLSMSEITRLQTVIVEKYNWRRTANTTLDLINTLIFRPEQDSRKAGTSTTI